MASESVLFEIQVEKKILEQLLIDNENFRDAYTKLNQLEEKIRLLKEENHKLVRENEDYEKSNKQLTEENVKLHTDVKQLERYKKIFEGKSDTFELENTESKLLTMKLTKMEKEKTSIVDKYEQEKTILEELLRDNSMLKKTEQDLSELKENFENLTSELKKTKKLLTKSDDLTKRLDLEKLELETQIHNLQKKIRLLEEENISNALEEVENGMLRLKLKNVENEKKYLTDEVEREKKLMNLHSKPRMARVEENLKLLRKWVEKEMKERHGWESKEDKALKEKIQSLEKDKVDLAEGFELERKVFRKILKNNVNVTY